MMTKLALRTMAFRISVIFCSAMLRRLACLASGSRNPNSSQMRSYSCRIRLSSMILQARVCSMPRKMFWITVKVGTRLVSWWMTAMPALQGAGRRAELALPAIEED